MPPREPLSPKIAQLQAKLQKDPNSKLFLQLAEEYRRAGAGDIATRVCEEGLRRNPMYHTARVLLGQIYLEAGKHVEARRELERVLQGSPDNIKAGKILAPALAFLGETGEALQVLRRMQLLSPGDIEIEQMIRELGNRAQALSHPQPAAPPALSSSVRRPAAMQEAAGILLDDAPPDIEEIRRPSSFSSEEEPESPAGVGRRIPMELSMGVDLQPEVGLDQEIAQVSALDPVLGEALIVTPSPDLLPPELQTDREGSEPNEEEIGLETATMAELYARQGHLSEAIRVYETLSRSGRGSSQTAARLEELRGLDALRGAEGVDPSPEATARKKEVLLSWLSAIQSERRGR